MLGVGLRKLCPQDSFGYAFRENKTVRKSTPGGCKSGAVVPNFAAKAAWKPCLGGSGSALRALLAPPGPLLGRPGPLLGASWGSFWAFQGADLNDQDDVCDAT